MGRGMAPGRLAALVGDVRAQRPAYGALAASLARLVDEGRLAPGTRLPSERELAAALDLSRTTVTRAYGLLVDSGHAVSRHGSGTTVQVPSLLGRRVRGGLMPAGEETGDVIDLTSAVLPAPAAVGEACTWAAEQLRHHLGGSGYLPLGQMSLREAVARQYTERGLPTTAEEVLITSGATSAHAVVGSALLGPGARLLAESPVYPNGLAALRAGGARVASWPLDPDGWSIDALRVALQTHRPRAALLLPDHQNPTGLVMDDPTRARVAGMLRAAGTVAVVDETLVGTGLDGDDEPLPFAAHAAGAISIGGVSKSVWSGLRIGWVRARPQVVARLLDARLRLDLGCPVLEQLAVERLLPQVPDLARERADRLRASRDALTAALAEQLPHWRFRIPAGGLSLWVELPRPASTALAVAAEQEGVRIAPGNTFAVETGLDHHLRLPFTRAPEVLVEGVARLARTWERLPERPGRSVAPARVIA